MTITVSTYNPTPKAKKQWKPQHQRRSLYSNQTEAMLEHAVIKTFDELNYHVSKGGQRFDTSVTFTTRGFGMHDLIFKNEGGLTKWQNAKKWLQEVKVWRG